MKQLIIALILALPLSAQFTTYDYLVFPPFAFGFDSTTATTSLDLDASPTTRSKLFANYGQACRVKAAYFSLASITSSQSIRVTIQDPATTGLPDGSADATCDVASPAVGVNTCTFSSSVLKGAGARFFGVIGWTSTQGSVNLEASNLGVRAGAVYFDYSVSGTSKITDHALYFALGCDDDNNGTVDRIRSPPHRMDFVPQQGFRAFKSDDTPDEYGAIFTFADDVRAVGACFGVDIANNDAATFELDISALASGASLCFGSDGCADGAMLDEDWREAATLGSFGCLPFDEMVTIPGGTSYVVSWRATSTTAANSELLYADFGAGNDALLQAIGSGGMATRSDKGSWTSGATACWSGGPNCDDAAPVISLILSGIETPTAPSGVSYGSVQ